MGITLQCDNEHAEKLSKEFEWRDNGKLQHLGALLRKSVGDGNKVHTIHVPAEYLEDYTYLSNTLIPYGWSFQQGQTDEEGPCDIWYRGPLALIGKAPSLQEGESQFESEAVHQEEGREREGCSNR